MDENTKTTPATNATEQAVHEMRIFMGLTCKECEGLGWYGGMASNRCGEPYEAQFQCETCNGTGEL